MTTKEKIDKNPPAGPKGPMEEINELRAENKKLKADVVALEKQMELALDSREVSMLRDVLADQKAKLGDTDAILAGLALLEKLDSYLKPSLFPEKETAEE